MRLAFFRIILIHGMLAGGGGLCAGTPVPCPRVAALYHYALSFPGGASDMVTVADHDSLSLTGGDLTIEFWFCSLADQDSALVGKWGEGGTPEDDEYLVLMQSGGKIIFSLRGTGNDLHVPGAISLYDWHHVACTFDAATGEGNIYIDGALAGSRSGMVAVDWNTTVPLRMAGQTITPGSFNGSIDEVRISDVVRYRGAFTLPCRLTTDGNTRGLWHFDEGSGSMVQDASSRGNNGVVNGGVYWYVPAYCIPTPTPVPSPSVTLTRAPTGTPSPTVTSMVPYPTPLCGVYTLVFADDFENYQAGTYPSSGGWQVLHSGQNAEVVDSTSFRGNHSFRQTCAAGWARNDIHDVPYHERIKLSFAFMRDTDGNASGVNLRRSASEDLTAVYLDPHSREVSVFRDATGVIYSLNQWTRFEIEADFTTMRYAFSYNGTFIRSGAIPETVNYAHLMFSAGNEFTGGHAYWDDIRFYHCAGASPTPTPSFSPLHTPLPCTWQQLSPSLPRPAARQHHGMVYNSDDAKLYLFGGNAGSTFLGDFWSYTPSSGRWTQLHPTDGPGARAAFGMVYDSDREKIILYGGGTAPYTYSAELWEYDPQLNRWDAIMTTGGPGARDSFGMVYDDIHRKVILFGGYTGSTFQLNDTWEYDPSTAVWTRVTSSALAPPVRDQLHTSMLFDGDRGRVVIFGGRQGWGQLDDMWEYDPGTGQWTEITPAYRPGARQGHAMAYDAACRKIYLVGGYAGAGLLSDYFWEYDPVASLWNDITPGAGPGPNGASALVYDRTGETFFLYGGYDGAYSDGLWSYSCDCLPVSPTPTPVETPTAKPPDTPTGMPTPAGTSTLTPTPGCVEKILFAARAGAGDPLDIFLANPDGSSMQNLTGSLSGSASEPEFSPDGRRICFISDATGHWQVYVMNIDGSGIACLTVSSAPYGPGQPSWYDNDSIMYYAGPQAGDGQIRLIQADGTNDRLLNDTIVGQPNPGHPARSPDGSRIVLAAQAGSWAPSYDLYLVDADGVSNESVFYADSVDDFNDGQPVWKDNDVIYWQHSMTSGTYNENAIIARSRSSANPATHYDAVIRSSISGARNDLSLGDFSPDGTRFLFSESLSTTGTWSLITRTLVTGIETVLLSNYDRINMGDWACLPVDLFDTPTPAGTPTVTSTPTPANSPTAIPTMTPTVTSTPTPANSPTSPPTMTPTVTPTPLVTVTPCDFTFYIPGTGGHCVMSDFRGGAYAGVTAGGNITVELLVSDAVDGSSGETIENVLFQITGYLNEWKTLNGIGATYDFYLSSNRVLDFYLIDDDCANNTGSVTVKISDQGGDQILVIDSRTNCFYNNQLNMVPIDLDPDYYLIELFDSSYAQDTVNCANRNFINIAHLFMEDHPLHRAHVLHDTTRSFTVALNRRTTLQGVLYDGVCSDNCGGVTVRIRCVTPVATPVPTRTPARTATPAVTATPLVTVTPSPSRSPTPTITPTVTIVPSFTPTRTPVPPTHTPVSGTPFPQVCPMQCPVLVFVDDFESGSFSRWDLLENPTYWSIGAGNPGQAARFEYAYPSDQARHGIMAPVTADLRAFSLELDFWVGTWYADLWIFFNEVDTQNYNYIGIFENAGESSPDRICKLVGGAHVFLDTHPVTVDQNDWHRVKLVRCVTGEIEVYLDGSLYMSAVDTTFMDASPVKVDIFALGGVDNVVLHDLWCYGSPTVTPAPSSTPTGTPVVTATPAPTGTPGLPGDEIVFSSNRRGTYDIWVMNADGSNQQPVTSLQGDEKKPQWSPDGSMIAFVYTFGSQSEIYRVNADGSDIRQLTNTASTGADTNGYGNIAWHPSGDRIFYTHRQSGKFTIHSITADGTTDALVVTNSGTHTSMLDINPAGTDIVYHYDAGNWAPDRETRLHEIAGGNETVILPNDGRAEDDGRFSNDGRQILYSQSDSSSGWQDPWNIKLMNSDGSGVSYLTSVSGTIANRNPDWSPLGDKIVYTSDISGNNDIWVMNADGTGPLQLTTDTTNDQQPHWKPASVATPTVTPIPAATSTVTLTPTPTRTPASTPSPTATPTGTPASSSTPTSTPTPAIAGYIFEGVPPYTGQPGIGDVVVTLYDPTTGMPVAFESSDVVTGYYSFSTAPAYFEVLVGTGSYQISLTGMVSTNPHPPAYNWHITTIPNWAGGPDGIGLSFFDPPFDFGFMAPTPLPTLTPTLTPSPAPTETPASTPTHTPTIAPTRSPTVTPTVTTTPTRTPAATPSTTPTPVELVINEVLYYTTGEELIELYNSGASAVNLANFRLHVGVTDVIDQYYLLPPVTVQAGEYLVIHWNVAGVDLFPDYYTGTTGTVTRPVNDDFGYVALFRNNPPGAATIIDYVEYGKAAMRWEAEAVLAGIWTAGDFVPFVAPDHSIGLCPNGVDTNSSTDWEDLWFTTLGSANGCGVPTPTPPMLPTSTATTSPTETPTITPVPRPTSTPTPLPTATAILTGTHTPTHSATPAPTATPTAVPSSTSSPQPTMTSTPPPSFGPLIMAGGYREMPGLSGGPLTLLAYITDPDGPADIERVELFYHGSPLGVELRDDGTQGDFAPNDGIYGFHADLGPVASPIHELLEIRAADRSGNESALWPYLTVTGGPSPAPEGEKEWLYREESGWVHDYMRGYGGFPPESPLTTPMTRGTGRDVGVCLKAVFSSAFLVSREKDDIPAITRDSLLITNKRGVYTPRPSLRFGAPLSRGDLFKGPNPPEIKLAGYMDTEITTAHGGELNMLAVVHDPDGAGDIATVELYYQGVGTGVFLDFHEANGANAAYGLTVPVSPGVPAGRYLIELVATDHSGNESARWPWLVIE